MITSTTDNSWRRSLAIGFASVVGFIVFITIIFQLTRRPHPDFLSAQVKPQILKEWQKHPVLRKLTIQDIRLEHTTGNEYAGWIDCSLGGHTTRVSIDVTVKNGKAVWRLNPGQNGFPIREMHFNGAQVFVAFSVSDDEAKKFGNCLVHEGIFDGAEVPCLLSRSGEIYEIYLAVKKGVENDADAQETFRKLGAELSTHVFHSAPVDIHMCDATLATLKVIPHQ